MFEEEEEDWAALCLSAEKHASPLGVGPRSRDPAAIPTRELHRSISMSIIYSVDLLVMMSSPRLNQTVTEHGAGPSTTSLIQCLQYSTLETLRKMFSL